MNITRIEPGTAQRGDTITVVGEDLGALGPWFVIFHTGLVPDPGHRMTAISGSATGVTVRVPEDAVTGPIRVKDRNGRYSNYLDFSVGAPPGPAPPTDISLTLDVVVGGEGARYAGMVDVDQPLSPGSQIIVNVYEALTQKNARQTFTVPPAPVPDPVPAGVTLKEVVNPATGDLLSSAVQGSPIDLHGTGFGTVAGTVYLPGGLIVQGSQIQGWADGRIVLTVPAVPALTFDQVGPIKVTRPDGGTGTSGWTFVVRKRVVVDPPPPPAGDDLALAREVIRLTNLERAKVGVEPVGIAFSEMGAVTLSVFQEWRTMGDSYTINTYEGWISWANLERRVWGGGMPIREASPALGEHGELVTAAQKFSEELFSTGVLTHTGKDGSDPGQRMGRAGYSPLTGWGENVAQGYSTPAAVVAGWMGSAGHRANMLNPNLKHIGVGHRSGWWVMDLAAGEGGSPTPPPPPDPGTDENRFPSPAVAGNPPADPD